MKPTWRIFEIGLFVALVSVIGRPTTVNSQSKDIIEGAKKEGRVLLYTALTIHEIDEISVPFVKKYPFLKVEPFRGNALQLLQKITIEARAGRAQVDVAQFNGFEAGNCRSSDCYRATSLLKQETIPMPTKTRQDTGRHFMLTTWCSASIRRWYRVAMYQKNGRIFYNLNGEATDSHSIGTTRSGIAAWTFTGERKRLTSL